MNIQFLILFITLSVVNVVFNTIKSIVTVKGGATASALINAITFGVYTFVVFYTTADGMSLWGKAIITAITNFIGVYVVKIFEQKMRKDKLWKVTMTIATDFSKAVEGDLRFNDISFYAIDTKNYMVYDCYCKSQAETATVAKVCKDYGGKMFATENTLPY